MNARDILHYGHLTVQETLARVPMADWEVGGVCGVWSVKDIVAHLASYELLLVDVLATFVDGRPTPLLDSLLAAGAAVFNDVEVAKREAHRAREVLAEYDAAYRQVTALLPQLAEETLRQPGTLPWYGAEYALDDYLVYSFYGHKREHSAQVAVFADQLTEQAVQTALRFNDALNARDVDAMMRLMTPTCVFENTFPAPDGTRLEGQAAVRAFWEAFFRDTPETTIEVEEVFGAGARCVMRWCYRWVDPAGQPGHVRGADVYAVENGLVAEKHSYVKG